MIGTGSLTNAQVATLAAATVVSGTQQSDATYDEWFEHILSKLNNVPQLVDERTFGDR